MKLKSTPLSFSTFVFALLLSTSFLHAESENLKSTKKLAASGNSEAQYRLGFYFGYGSQYDETVTEDDKLSFEWYLKAAESGHPEAQYDLASAYDNGWGTPENPYKAQLWYKKAFDNFSAMASKGDPNSQLKVGQMYHNGEGTEKDELIAMQWYQRAASNGNIKAQWTLGLFFSVEDKNDGTDDRIPQDLREALKWYERAASQGDVAAQHQVGYFYFHGQGMYFPDYSKAYKWFLEAAKNGGGQSTYYYLGLMNEKGLSKPQNFPEAYKWYILAAMNGWDTYVSARDRIAGLLGPEQILEQQMNAQNWINNHPVAKRKPPDWWNF